MKAFVLTLIVLAPVLSYSNTFTEEKSFSPILEEDEPRVAGYTDANGKQGWWIIRGKDYPEKGYPSEGKIEEGNYKDDRKVGEWIVYHTDGITPRLIGNFVDGRPNGPYKKMNAQGIVVEKGDSYNKKQRGEFITYYDSGTPKQIKNFNADGKEDGDITFLYEDGTVQYKGSAVNGIPVGEGTRYWPDGSVKEIVTYGPTGEITNTKVVNAEPPVAIKVESGTGGPDGAKGLLLDGNSFKPDGYNIVYNKNKELWMEGTFKNSKLWNGKLYKYDEEGILLKFEVWKNGAYHSDGQL
jgi:hypothetical protein